MTNDPPSLRIPLMIPELPTLEVLTPYLRRIDQNRWYSNFGPLSRELEERLAATFNARAVQSSDATSSA